MKENGNQEILTLREVAIVLRCSKAHAAKLLNGECAGYRRSPTLRWAGVKSCAAIGWKPG